MINIGKPITITDSATTPTKWWCKDLDLTEDDRLVLMDDRWLSDKHMSAAAKLIKIQFPETRGFQSTITKGFTPATSEPYYQFHFYNSHWCVSWMRDGTVTLCNSLLNTKTELSEASNPGVQAHAHACTRTMHVHVQSLPTTKGLTTGH